MERIGTGCQTGGLGLRVRRVPGPGGPAQHGERLPASSLRLLELVLPEHGVGPRAGQERGADWARL